MMKHDNSNQNPWAGLSSYEDPAKSEQKLKFCGRDNETKEVARLIDDNFFVTLYGKSGIGKSSLLNAGVFPALRREQYTPLSLRLGMTEATISFQDVITQAIERAIGEIGGSVHIVNVIDEQAEQDATDYLWRWFASRRFLTADGQITFPVLVFDQFEEVLRQADSRRKTEVLLNQLNYLIDESHAISGAIVEGEAYSYDFNFRFVLSIREDDLYRLEDSLDNCSLSALKHCRYRLRSLTEQGVRNAILIPGKGLFKEEEENAIVNTIIAKSCNEDGSISTNIISLLCSRIFVDYQRTDAGHITTALVDRFIKGNPFERFYNEATRGFSNKEKSFIEDHLVDSTGRRNSIPESDFLLHVPKGKQLLEGDTRILQSISTSSDGSNYRIELIHDSFCEPLVGLKEKREKRKHLWLISIAFCIAVLSILSVVYVLNINNKMNVNMSRALAEKANQLTENGDSYLARIVALQALPPNRPYTVEADGALHKASLYDNAILKGHTSSVTDASFSPDGKLIVSSSFDGEIRFWNVENGSQVGEPIVVGVCSVNSASFSPDGRFIVSSYSNKIMIWDAKKRSQVRVINVEHTGRVYNAFFSPNGKYIFYNDGSGIGIWDLKKHKRVWYIKGRFNQAKSIFSPDCDTIISIQDDNTIRLWDIRNYQQVGQPLKGHTGLILSASFSNNGKYVVSTSQDCSIRIWDVNTCTQVDSILEGHSGYYSFASFSPDDKYIVSLFSSSNGKTDQIEVWDTNTRTQVGESLKGHTSFIRTSLFSPDGNYIVSASNDETIRIRDVKSIIQHKNILKGHTNTVLSASFTQDSKFIVSSSYDHTVLKWDVEKKSRVGPPLVVDRECFEPASLSSDGKYLVTPSSKTIRIYDVEKNSQVGSPLVGHTGEVNSASFSSDDKYIVSASGEDKTIRIWEVKTGRNVIEIYTGHYVRNASFSPDNKFIVFVATGSNIIIWDVKNRRQSGEPIHTSEIRSVLFSPDGKYIVSASEDKTIRIWDVKTGRQVGEPLKGHTERATFASYSPDGKYIVSASEDKTIRIWDVKTGRQVGEPLKGHTDNVYSVLFSPNGKYIASASRDGTIRIWKFPPLQQLIEQTRERFRNRPLTLEERRKYYLE